MNFEELESGDQVDEGKFGCREIWDTLLEGKKVAVDFSSMKEAENFRVRLHQIKARSEKHLIGIGFMEEDEIQSLSFILQPSDAAGETYTYVISLGKKKRSFAKFTMRIIED